MANNKVLYAIIVVLVLVIIGGAVFFMLNNQAGVEPKGDDSAVANQPAAEVAEQTLSEQPNQTKFNEYLTSAELAKLPVGAKFDPFKIIKTQIFSAGEQFCTSFNIKKTIPAGAIATAVYDVNTKQDVKPKSAFPQALQNGGSVGCESLEQSVGRYEYKIYLDDVLAVVLPFEVK